MTKKKYPNRARGGMASIIFLKRYTEGSALLAIEDYNRNPRLCRKCNDVIPYERRENVFCSHSCSASFNNKGICRVEPKTKHYYCKECGKLAQRKYVFCSKECRILYKDKEFIKSTKLKIETNQAICHVTVKTYLLKTRDYKCEECGLSIWNEKPITLEAHHKDGDYRNNKDHNLILLCPNCHSQTDTYRIGNKGNGRPYRIPKRFMK